MKTTLTLLNLFLFAVVVAIQNVSAQMIVNEDFESYADTAAMLANWSGGPGVLVSTNGNTGNSAYHLGGTVNNWAGSAISLTPSSSESIILRADIYDDASSAVGRMTVGLRNGADPLFEMGHYNSFTTEYAVRVLSIYGSPSWVAFPDVTRTTGWNRYEAIFTGSDLTITLDIGADGSIDSTLHYTGAPSANPFTDLRFGGPSNLSSAAPGWFDNIQLQVVSVPEPTALVLGGLGGLLLFVAVRRGRKVT